MKLHVIPGQTVQLVRCPTDQTRAEHTSFAAVSAVSKGVFLVPEADSANGFAKVACHGNSGKSGTYWYEYRDRKGEGHSEDVVGLYSYPEGSRIIAGSFFE